MPSVDPKGPDEAFTTNKAGDRGEPERPSAPERAISVQPANQSALPFVLLPSVHTTVYTVHQLS